MDERDVALWHECGVTDPALIRNWDRRGYKFWGQILDREENSASRHPPAFREAYGYKHLPHFVHICDLSSGSVHGIDPIPYCIRDTRSAVVSLNNSGELVDLPMFDAQYTIASMAHFISVQLPPRFAMARTFRIIGYRYDYSHLMPGYDFLLTINSFGATTVRMNPTPAYLPAEEEVRRFNQEGWNKLPKNFEGFETLILTPQEQEAILAERGKEQDPQKQKTKKRPPREIGLDPVSGNPILLKDGKFGPYVTDGLTNASLKSHDSVGELSLERAIDLLALKRA